MKSVIHLLIITCVAVLVNACSNDFLDENLSVPIIPTGESSLIISPEWEEATYSFSCPIAKNVEFTIEEAPEWLQLVTKEGNLSYTSANTTAPQSIGSVRAKAKAYPAYAKTGVYIEYMKVKADGVLYQVPVYYITEGTPKVSVSQTLSISYNSYSDPTLLLRNTGDGILFWDIVSMPDWLNVDTENLNMEGIIIPKDGQYSIPLAINANTEINDNQLNGTIVLRTNDKDNPTVGIQVTANLGSPVLYLSGLYSGSLDFGASAWTYSFSIYNQGSGWLAWEFTDLPDWLTVNKTKGNLLSYNSETIQFTCDGEKIAPGQNTATIQLKSNDPNRLTFNITVTARGSGNNASTYAIEGKIVDAAIDRSRNMLIYATSQPNKLIFYDLGTKTIAHEIALSKAPTCFTVAEDFSTAAVGHGGMISAVNLTNYTVTKTIALSNTVYDIAWTGSSMYCYAEQTDYSDYIYWVDISDETKTSMLTRDVDGKTRIKKVPTQPFMVASRQQSSPTGFITYSIAGRTLQSYAHKDLSNFWFSENGDFTYASSGDIYRTSSATGSTETFNATINSIGKLTDGTGSTQYYPWWVDHLSSKNKLFVINYHYANKPVIYQFDDNDYLLEKSYSYDKIYQPDSGTTSFEVQAHYVFANKEGTELVVLRKGKADDNMVWSMEFLEVI